MGPARARTPLGPLILFCTMSQSARNFYLHDRLHDPDAVRERALSLCDINIALTCPIIEMSAFGEEVISPNVSIFHRSCEA